MEKIRYTLIATTLFLVSMVVLTGADWSRIYAHVGNELKFVKIETNIGPAYVNVSHIVSIRVTNSVGQEGKTEIALVNGTEFYSAESLEQVIVRIIEK